MSLYVDIKKRYSGFTLDISFESETLPLGILGASGSGKSMTLKCIAGIVKPDDGRIAVDGHVLFDSKEKINLRPQERRVGYLFQNHALFPHLTVEKNIAEALQGPKSGKVKKIENLLSRFELDDLGHRYPAQLSGGQQQRVAVARVLASDPEVLLLDEPFSALDAYLKESLQMDMKKRLQDFEGYSVMVTHDRDEVYKLCPKLMLLEAGRVDRLDRTAEIFRQPGTVVAARLSGCKNISRAEQVNHNTVRALDWNLDLRVATEILEDLSYIGIRAHAFKPVYASKDNTEKLNWIAYDTVEEVDSPFERNILFRVKGSSDSEPIWWKLPKEELKQGRPEYLTVDSEDILLLSSGKGASNG